MTKRLVLMVALGMVPDFIILFCRALHYVLCEDSLATRHWINVLDDNGPHIGAVITWFCRTKTKVTSDWNSTM